MFAEAGDGAGAFATGQYPNLFATSGHSQKEIDAKINAAMTSAPKACPTA
jgi:hypothetical protein